MNIQEIKKRKEDCEKEVEAIISLFEKSLPEEIILDSAVVLADTGKPTGLKCTIKLKIEGL